MNERETPAPKGAGSLSELPSWCGISDRTFSNGAN